MPAHKFQIGGIVHISPTRIVPGGFYKVIKQLPEINGELSMKEPRERVRAGERTAQIMIILPEKRSHAQHQNTTCRPLHAKQSPAFYAIKPLCCESPSRTSV
jgi:hypothetical protein